MREINNEPNTCAKNAGLLLPSPVTSGLFSSEHSNFP